MKTFALLSAIKYFHIQKFKLEENEIPLSDALLKIVFVAFGFYCLIYVFRFLQEYFLFVKDETSEQEDLAEEPEVTLAKLDKADKLLISALLKSIRSERERAAKIHPKFNFVVASIDFIVPIILMAASFSVACGFL